MVKEILEEIAGAFSQGYRSSRNWTNPRSGTVQGLPQVGVIFLPRALAGRYIQGGSVPSFSYPQIGSAL